MKFIRSDEFSFSEKMEKSVPYFKVVSDCGEIEGQWRYSFCLFWGYALKPKQKEAIKILKSCIEKNSVSALVIYSWCQEEGSKEEISTLRKLVKMNHPVGFWNMGGRLLDGKGVIKDERKGRIYLLKAAENGWGIHAKSISLFYRNGLFGFNRSESEANKFLSISKNHPVPDEQYFSVLGGLQIS